MKQKISISVDEETLKRVTKEVEKGRFRNKSHAFEYSIDKIMKEKQ